MWGVMDLINSPLYFFTHFTREKNNLISNNFVEADRVNFDVKKCNLSRKKLIRKRYNPNFIIKQIFYIKKYFYCY